MTTPAHRADCEARTLHAQRVATDMKVDRGLAMIDAFYVIPMPNEPLNTWFGPFDIDRFREGLR